MRPAANASASLSDAEVMASVARGDLHALGMLFDRYEDAVRRFVGRLGVAPADIDDLVQLTFLDVPRAAQRFDEARPFKNWLLGLSAMVVRRHRRSVGRMAARLAAWASDPSHEAPHGFGDELEQRESAMRAMRALQKLSHKKREVFVMLALENVSCEETAQALGVPLATVWTRMHHARRDLRHLLRNEGR